MLGYRTPYIGKWHLSDPPTTHQNTYLERYGFHGFIIPGALNSNPDPVGVNGEGQLRDTPDIAATAVQWLQQNARKGGPFCLTVSFVNPHDKQYFWAGSEGDSYESMFSGQSLKAFNTGYQSQPNEDDPPPLEFPAVPPNWESYDQLAEHGKPGTQQVFRSFQELVWGGVTDDPSATTFSLQPSPNRPSTYGVAVSPYSYWQRGLDMYTQVLHMVDQSIGEVLRAIPKSQLGNTLIVFASDHGEYAGAHGMLSGKIGTAYDEAIRIPMIVTDPSGRFTRAIDKPRRQMTSSVDILPLLVTLGNRGSSSWMTGRLEKIYGERLNIVKLLRNPGARGRSHVLFSTDEVMPAVLNYQHAPTHVLAVRTSESKCVTYTHWVPGTTRPIPESMQLEFYDYSTEEGRAETRSLPDDPRAKAMARRLFNQYVPQQMEAPLPAPLKRTVARARASYIEFEAMTNGLTPEDLEAGKLQRLAGYGTVF